MKIVSKAPCRVDLAGGTLDTKALDAIVGATGDMTGQVYKYTIGRTDLTMKEMGATINARMGLNTWAAFYGSSRLRLPRRRRRAPWSRA